MELNRKKNSCSWTHTALGFVESSWLVCVCSLLLLISVWMCYSVHLIWKQESIEKIEQWFFSLSKSYIYRRKVWQCYCNFGSDSRVEYACEGPIYHHVIFKLQLVILPQKKSSSINYYYVLSTAFFICLVGIPTIQML